MPFTLSILAVILTYTWWFADRFPHGSATVPVAIVTALGLWRALATGEWGFRWRALWPATRLALSITLPAVLGILAVGAAVGTLHDRRDFLGSLGGLTLWGGAQQWILQTVVLREAQRITSSTWGVPIAALLFAAVHLPNVFLTAVTFGGGLVWCGIYSRHPNILPLAVSHGLGTLAILHAFDAAITGRLRIGHAYLLLGQ